jgi:hypothetical protein
VRIYHFEAISTRPVDVARTTLALAARYGFANGELTMRTDSPGLLATFLDDRGDSLCAWMPGKCPKDINQ